MNDNKANHAVVTSVKNEKTALSQAWECVLHGTHAYYVSGPITTGPRFIEWYESIGKMLTAEDKYKLSHHSHVISPNTRDLRFAAIHLRETKKLSVIEPGSLHMPSWSQSDYLSLWKTVIQRFVRRIVLLDGWEYSFGCINEIKEAMALNLPIEDIGGDSLDYDLCLSKIHKAISDLKLNNNPFYKNLEKAINNQT